MTRITHQHVANSTLANLQLSLGRIAKAQEQLSSGRSINRPSDNPTGTVAALGLRGDVRAAEQHLRNSQDGIGWLAITDNTLTAASTAMIRVGEIVTSASNATQTSVASREALATELEGLKDYLVTLGNANYLGRPVFGGTTSGAVAFQQSGNYVGDTGGVQRRVGAQTQIRVDTPAEAAWGPNGATFSLLGDIVTDLRAGTPLTGRIDQIKDAHERIMTTVADVGARYGRVVQLQTNTESRLLDLKSSLSTVENVDLPAAIVDLQTQQVAYQAALGATAKIVQPNLMDFLR